MDEISHKSKHAFSFLVFCYTKTTASFATVFNFVIQQK